jgi:hypothetical protein
MIMLFAILTVIDLGGALIIFAGALGERMRLYPTWHKLGLMMASLGLAAQGVRNIQFMVTGISPTDADLPLWALKDLGIGTIAFFYLYLAVTNGKRNG